MPAPPPGAAFGGGEITVNQMYVQYQIPTDGDRHVPVVMVHGCCLSSKTWETTPDGRMGWDEYFVREDRSVYLADQVSRARSGFDATVIGAVKNGSQPPSALPNIICGEPPGRVDGISLRPELRQAFPGRPVSDRSRRRALQADDSGLERAAADAESDLGQHGGAREAVERRRAHGAFRERLLSGAGRADRCVRHPRHDLDRAAVPGGSDRRDRSRRSRRFRR